MITMATWISLSPVTSYTNEVRGNLLYRNDGNFHFTDVATEAGIKRKGFRKRAAAWADYDLDGFIDFFISELIALYRNNGDGTFTNVTRRVGIAKGKSNSAAWGDFDNDGYPDLYVVGGFWCHSLSQ